jgi:hypothetical protein
MKNNRKFIFLTVALSAISTSAGAENLPYVRKINFQPQKDQSLLVLEYEGNPAVTVNEDARIRQVTILVPGAQLPASLTRIIDFAAQESPVVQITPYNTGGTEPGAKIVLQLREQVDLAKEQIPGKFTLKLKTLGAMAKGISHLNAQTQRAPAETDRLPALGAFKSNVAELRGRQRIQHPLRLIVVPKLLSSWRKHEMLQVRIKPTKEAK